MNVFIFVSSFLLVFASTAKNKKLKNKKLKK